MVRQPFAGWMLAGGLLMALAAGANAANYRVGEGGETTAPVSAPADDGPAPGTTRAADADAGPVRLARFSYLQGDVSWRPDISTPWAAATQNLPIRQGAQVWASGHSRAEVQFDDGSRLRLGADAVVTLETLYSDAQGEFTELRLSQGLASLTLPHAKSVFQVDTLTASLKAAGPARFRVGASPGAEVVVRAGKVTLEDAQGKTFLEAGDYIDVTDPKAAFDIQDAPAADGFDRFAEERDQAMDEGQQDKHLSPQEALVAGNLDDYGQWRDDPPTATSGCPPNRRPGGLTMPATGSGWNRSAGPGWGRAVGLGAVPLRHLGPRRLRLGLVSRPAHPILVARRGGLRRFRRRHRLGAPVSV